MKFKLSIIFALFLTILCANRLQAQEKAFPKKGEGVTLFLKRHNRTGAAYQKQFIEVLIRGQSDGLAKSSCTKTNMLMTSCFDWHAT